VLFDRVDQPGSELFVVHRQDRLLAVQEDFETGTGAGAIYR
jgi:hypothetical protein